MTHLYFGYGSTLDIPSWTRAGLHMRPVGTARLPDNVLAFDYRSRRRGCGVLNLRARLGGVVQGCLFELNDASRTELDRREGHPNAYRREEVVVLDAQGRERRAFTYRVVPERVQGFVAPDDAYMASCLAGRERFALSTDDVEAAAEGREAPCPAVFAYGTLMRGEQRASSWKDLDPSCILLARAFGTLHDHGAFPGFVPGGDGMVEGEFMRFEDIGAALARFDRIEGFAGFGSPSNLFRRTLVEVDVGRGRIRTAWTYATCFEGAPRIAGGDWRRAKGRHLPAMSAILSAHASAAPDFFAKLACVPDGPFGTVCEMNAGHDEILMRLVAGGFDERGLCRASGLWNAGA